MGGRSVTNDAVTGSWRPPRANAVPEAVRPQRFFAGRASDASASHIAREMRRLLSWLAKEQKFRNTSAADFAVKVAHFMAELNAIHPFREGNGRTQLTFLSMLASDVGHPPDLDRLDTDAVLDAMIRSFSGHEEPLRAMIPNLIA